MPREHKHTEHRAQNIEHSRARVRAEGFPSGRMMRISCIHLDASKVLMFHPLKIIAMFIDEQWDVCKDVGADVYKYSKLRVLETKGDLSN